MPLGNIALREAIDDGRLSISPKPRFPKDYDTDAVHLHIGKVFYVLRHGVEYRWDPNRQTITQFWQRQMQLGNAKKIVLRPGQKFWLRPGRVALAETKENVALPLDRIRHWGDKPLLSGKFSGRSRYARAWVGVHVTADIFHPGSKGTKAAELHNLGPITVAFSPGDPAFQLQCDQIIGEMVATENFANGQHSAIGEREQNFGPGVVRIAEHPRYKQKEQHPAWRRNRHRAGHKKAGGSNHRSR